jgi:heterodisulfide reductase subunit B
MTSQKQTNVLTGNKTENRTFTCPVVEFEGELAVEFPDELIEELGWEVGDVLKWEKVMNDRFILKLVRKNNE